MLVIMAIPCYAIEEIEVDKESGEIQNSTFEKTFDTEFNEDTLKEDILDANYVIVDEDKDSLTVVDSFETKTLIVKGKVDAFNGAEVERDGNFTVLRYKTVKEAKQAYDELVKIFGEENVSPDAPIKCKSTATKLIGLDSFMPVTANSNRKVKVAVLDTGINTEHKAFNGRTVVKDCIFDDLEGKDVEGHGTAVCGTVAESTPSNVTIHSIRITNKNDYASLLSIKYGLQKAVEVKANVVNVSWGVDLEKNSILVDYLDTEFKQLNNAGAVVCVAAGNESTTITSDATIKVPAASKYVLAIGAVDRRKGRRDFSNYGPELDFVAQGHALSLPWYDGSYQTLAGTSFSSPYIAGMVANLKLETADMNFSKTYTKLKEMSEDLGAEGFDNYYGWGLPVYNYDAEKYKIGNKTIKYTTSYDYTGSAIKPTVTIDGLKQNEDFKVTYSDNVNVGTATLKVDGIGVYNGSVTKNFTIKRVKKNPKITLSATSFVYNGKVQKPTAKVDAMAEYQITIPSSKNVGQYYVTVDMNTPNCYGSAKKSYKINPKTPTVTVKRKFGKTTLTFTKGCQIKYNGKTYKVAGGSKTFKGTYKAKIRKYQVVNGKTFYSAWITK